MFSTRAFCGFLNRMQSLCQVAVGLPSVFSPCRDGKRCADQPARGQRYPDLPRWGSGGQCHRSLGAQESGHRFTPRQMGWRGKEAASEVCAA